MCVELPLSCFRPKRGKMPSNSKAASKSRNCPPTSLLPVASKSGSASTTTSSNVCLSTIDPRQCGLRRSFQPCRHLYLTWKQPHQPLKLALSQTTSHHKAQDHRVPMALRPSVVPLSSVLRPVRAKAPNRLPLYNQSANLVSRQNTPIRMGGSRPPSRSGSYKSRGKRLRRVLGCCPLHRTKPLVFNQKSSHVSKLRG